jgi:hypothetical protein
MKAINNILLLLAPRLQLDDVMAMNINEFNKK